MTILFTICGRAGSKGIPNKNICRFLGKPLPYYTVSAVDLYLKRYGEDIEADIAVNTDSEELIRLMVENPLRKIEVIRREESLAGDTVGKIDVIANTLATMEERKSKEYRMIVDLDITAPLRTVEDIHHLIQKHLESGADVTTSVTTARRNPYFNQLKKADRGYKRVLEGDVTARQQVPEVWDMNASLYAYSPDFLRSGKGVLDGYCEVISMYDTGILDLDHENDFELMQVVAGYLFEKNKEFAEVADNI